MNNNKFGFGQIKSTHINKTLSILLVKELFKETPYYIETIHNGGRNKVYKVYLKNYGNLILRISLEQDRINDYIKEQWCWKKLKEIGVPMPEVLEVGNSIIPFPYMIVHFTRGIHGNKYISPDLKVFREMGKLSKKIHSIKTTEYGSVFEWSHNTLSKNSTWRSYLENELKIWKSINLYEENKILTKQNQENYLSIANDLTKLKTKPSLVHGDYKLQNLLLNKECKIISIIDWELAQSNIPTYIEFSHTFFDFDNNQKAEFLKGYEMDWEEYTLMKPMLNVIFIARKYRDIKWAVENKNTIQLEALKKLFNSLLDKNLI